MRTRAKGNHCLTASRSARVCAKAHTFLRVLLFYKNAKTRWGQNFESISQFKIISSPRLTSRYDSFFIL